MKKKEREERKKKQTINEGLEGHHVLGMQEDSDDFLESLNGSGVDVDISDLVDGTKDLCYRR